MQNSNIKFVLKITASFREKVHYPSFQFLELPKASNDSHCTEYRFHRWLTKSRLLHLQHYAICKGQELLFKIKCVSHLYIQWLAKGNWRQLRENKTFG